MAYERQEWYNGDIISEDRLNHMEAGIADCDQRISSIQIIPATDEQIDDLFLDIGVEVRPSTAFIQVGDTYTLVAKVRPSTATVTWGTSNASIASVNNGVVTGNSAGNATITATTVIDGVTYTSSCSVTVTA